MRLKSVKMSSSLFEFPASLVKHYLYCPNIAYLVLFHGAKEATTEMMVAGKEEHRKMLKKLSREGWEVNVFLKSRKYGVYGYADAVKKEKNGYAVLELKNASYKKKILKSHLYQAACYAILVEENMGRVCRIILKYRDREIAVPFTRGIKKYCVSILNKMKEMAEKGLVSYRPDKKKCRNCGFFKLCMGI